MTQGGDLGDDTRTSGEDVAGVGSSVVSADGLQSRIAIGGWELRLGAGSCDWRIEAGGPSFCGESDRASGVVECIMRWPATLLAATFCCCSATGYGSRNIDRAHEKADEFA